ncbi:YcnI family protein [Naasia sp. SYSU D00057]|uniref:YcnI family copper-binding membrane protein n=1 Tax=Naasia sp. SYSU D00057 TaxID=2817380 RepID=UPI001B3143F1|nr:YcnI family protein [Naasia sp. SYSU D00057]
MHLPLPTRVGLGAGAALLLALSAPLSASAHVSVNPAEAEPGGYSQLTFRVPNERDDSGTVRLEVTLPTDTPFASVSYQPVPGWTTTVTTGELPEPVEVSGTELTEAVTGIVWQADPGVEIAPGQYQTFGISVGPVPDVGSVVLPARQTYASGEVVDWSGAEDAELPAPVLYVNDAPAEHSHGGAETAADSGATVSGGAGGDDGLARGLGITGLVLGALALVAAAFALVRSRRTA